MTEENQQVCTRCGITLTSTEATRPSIKFLAPLDYSDVRSVIPKGDDIIYSAVFNLLYNDPIKRSMFPDEYLSHVLLTKRGLAFQEGDVRRNVYVPWSQLFQIYMGAMLVRRKPRIYTFQFHTNPEYETPEEYKMRPWKFYFEYAPHVINEKKRTGNNLNLKKIQKLWYKFVDVIGEEEIEFIKNNNDFEEFKKHFSVLRESILEAVPKIARSFVKRSEWFQW
jgi:hypothetical protein